MIERGKITMRLTNGFGFVYMLGKNFLVKSSPAPSVKK